MAVDSAQTFIFSMSISTSQNSPSDPKFASASASTDKASLWSRALGRIGRTLALKRALLLVWQSSPRWTIASAILVVVQGILPLIPLWLIGVLVNVVSKGATSPDPSAVSREVILLVAAMGATVLVSASAGSLATFVSSAHAQEVSDFMSSVLQRKAVGADLEYYENAEYFDTLHRAQGEAPLRPVRIVNGLMQLGQNAIALIAVSIILAALHPALILVLIVGAIPGLLVRARFIGINLAWQRSRSSLERKTMYFNWVLTHSMWAKEVRLFDLGDIFITRHKVLRDQMRGELLGIARQRAGAEIGAQMFVVIPMFACIAYIALLALKGQIVPGTLVTYFLLFQRAQTTVQGLLGSALGLHEDNMFLTHIYEFLDLQPKIASPTDPVALPRPMQKGIRFENVHFSYPLSTRPALQGIDLHIAPGEVVAIVGENGSGKSTLVKLLCRLYDPDSGCLSIDGTDIRAMDVTDLRRDISVIFQDYVHYDLSARENIWVGHSDLDLNDERIEKAAMRSGAHEVIQRLPNGYETLLSRSFEDGEELSIGQWQKIAIARAFLRPSQVIVLDEPTSALDPRAEAEVFDKFRELVQDQAAILISHRLSTVKMADRICVMQDGRIVENGSHHELMEQGGVYADLFERQAAAYK